MFDMLLAFVILYLSMDFTIFNLRSVEVFEHQLHQSLADLIRWADLLLLDNSLIPTSQTRLAALVKDVREKMMVLFAEILFHFK